MPSLGLAKPMEFKALRRIHKPISRANEALMIRGFSSAFIFYRSYPGCEPIYGVGFSWKITISSSSSTSDIFNI